MGVVFRPEALREVLDARAWYEERSPGLGSDFARAVDAALARAERAPQAFHAIDRELRQVTLRRFPYALIYTPTDTGLVVVSCFHFRHKPGSWRRNAGDQPPG